MSTLFGTLKEADEATAGHMKHPLPGDRFHEMYSFWMHVIGRRGPAVAVREYIGPDKTQVRVFLNNADFQKAYSYGSIPGFWIMYRDRILPGDDGFELFSAWDYIL